MGTPLQQKGGRQRAGPWGGSDLNSECLLPQTSRLTLRISGFNCHPHCLGNGVLITTSLAYLKVNFI